MEDFFNSIISEYEYLVANENDTLNLGKDLAKYLKKDSILSLTGELRFR